MSDFSTNFLSTFFKSRKTVSRGLVLILLIFFNFFYSQKQKVPSSSPPSGYKVSNGNFDFTIPSVFSESPVTDDFDKGFKPFFEANRMSMPKQLYLLANNNSDMMLIMFKGTKLDSNFGKNENISTDQLNAMIADFRPLAKGTLEYYKINDLQTIKNSYTVGSVKTTIYYIYDYDQLLVTIIASAGNLPEWNSMEEKILKSFKRKKFLSNQNSYKFFDLKVLVDKSTEFSYGKDAVSQMGDLFKGLDEIAKKAQITEHINSNQLSNSANIYSKGVRGLLIMAKDLDFPHRNNELIGDDQSIEILKEMIDDIVDKEVPQNIEIIKSGKAKKYISPNGLCYVIKEVVAKKTDLLNQKISFDTSVFINLFHNNRWYTISGSYKDEKEKTFILETINNIDLE